MSQYVIFAGSTTDGKVYKQIVCDCGLQSTAGICSHVSDPMIVERMDGTVERPGRFQFAAQNNNFYTIK